MASAGTGGSVPPNFFLTPQQQSLLFAALNSNKQQSTSASANSALSLSPDSFESPTLANGDVRQEGLYLDNYDYEFGDSSFDFSFNGNDQSKLTDDGPGATPSESTENEPNEKRSHPDDEEDEDSPGNDPKRRESTEKVPKKPGRKPLTSEPSSKRKAQNRAAQRAFRERKEKHLKDLETKVEELEKASEAANHENSVLRAQVERMTTELGQYKQRISLLTTTTSNPPKDKISNFGKAAVGNIGDVNFQFEFPKFGMLPGPPVNKQQRSSSSPLSPNQNPSQEASPAPSQNDAKSPSHTQQSQRNAQFTEDLAKFSSMFSPSMNTSVSTGSRGSLDFNNTPTLGGNSSSPSASSHSNMGASSSCGTSPEPYTQSPAGFKPMETMATIGEENSGFSSAGRTNERMTSSQLDVSGFDWLAQQNGGQFDPQLFGDYRESQDSILTNPTFDDLFNDSLDADFFTPYNAIPAPGGMKLNLIDAIDAKQNDIDDEIPKKTMNCNQIWEKLQNCPKAQSGEFDLDGLCSELTKKAKCSGTGPVVPETDFDSILKKYMGKDVSSDRVANQLGIEVDRTTKPNGLGL